MVQNVLHTIALTTLIYAAVFRQIRPYLSLSVAVISPKPAMLKTQLAQASTGLTSYKRLCVFGLYGAIQMLLLLLLLLLLLYNACFIK